MFENNKRLISFGCSNTQGYALPDDSKFGKNPSKYAWSNVIAQHYGLEHDNKGIAGASNRLILSKILNYDYEFNDIVFILWSHKDRTTKFISPKERQNINAGILSKANVDSKIRKTARAWVKYFYTDYNSALDTAQYMHNAKLYLDSLNIKSFHMMQSKKSLKGMATDEIKYFLSFRVQNVFFEQHRHIPPLALDNGHAGVNGHKYFADAVIESINKNNTIAIKDII